MTNYLGKMGSGFRLAAQLVLITIAGPSALGFVAGYMTGQSGPDATVLAAVVPAVISAGGVVVFSGLRADNRHVSIISSACLLFFSVALFLGVNTGVHIRKQAAELNARQAVEQEIAFHQRRIQMLQLCSQQEFLLNKRRQESGLPPLPPEAICPYGLPR